MTNEEQFFQPTGFTIDEDINSVRNDPAWIEQDRKGREDVTNETAELLHEFTHKDGSAEHDPQRIADAFATMENSTRSIKQQMNILFHADTPEFFRVRVRQNILNLAVAGLVALDLRQFELAEKREEMVTKEALRLIGSVFPDNEE